MVMSITFSNYEKKLDEHEICFYMNMPLQHTAIFPAVERTFVGKNCCSF